MISSNRRTRFRSLAVLALSATVVSISAQESPTKLRATGAALESTTTVGAPQLDKSRRGGAMVPVIVKFTSDSVAAVAGTTLRANGLRQIDMTSPSATRQFSQLAEERRTFAAAVARSLPSSRIVHDLNVVVGGVSMVVPEEDIATLSRLPGVKKVYRDELLQLDTDRSPAFIGAKVLHALGNEGRGAGVVVGVLDTGIWPEHPSYSDPDPNGAAYPRAACDMDRRGVRVRQRRSGRCAVHVQQQADRRRPFHGDVRRRDRACCRPSSRRRATTTATARTPHRPRPATPTSTPASSACRADASRASRRERTSRCTKCAATRAVSASDSAAAVQQAIRDGVDVINFSISGGANPYSDAVSLAFLDAYNAGVFVAASAGNSGPGAEHGRPSRAVGDDRCRQHDQSSFPERSDGQRKQRRHDHVAAARA